jgi:4-amino-4-deoxy-L-arabinose transferase-like glycosyltransferase
MSFSGDWKLILRARPWWSIVALILIAMPWVFAVSQRNPEFLRFFFVHEHFERFLSRVHARYQPVWFFVPILLIGFMPWTPLLPKVVADNWRSWRAGDRVILLLALWSVFVFTFFSLSQSKLIPYILPMFPALALLSARTLAALDARTVARYLWVASAVWLLVAAVAIVLYATNRLEESAGSAGLGLTLAFVFGGITAVVAALLVARRFAFMGVCVAAASTLILTSTALIGAQRLPGMWEASALARQVQSHLTARTVLYCVDDYLQSVPFYLNRTCTMVGYRGELDFGLQQEASRWIPDLTQFAARWRGETDATAIVRRESYDKLASMGLPMRVIFTGPEMIVVARN